MRRSLKMIKMKNKLFLFAVIPSISFVAGCNSKGASYSANKISYIVNKEYQLYDTFFNGDLSVQYNGADLDPHQYNIDSTEFDSSEVGETHVTISLAVSPKTKLEVPLKIEARTSINFLAIGDAYSEDLVTYANEIANNSTCEFDFNIYCVKMENATLEDHYQNLYRSGTTYTLMEYDDSAQIWKYNENKSLVSTLSYKSWDAISIQESNRRAGISDYYEYLSLLINGIKAYYSTNNLRIPTLAFHQNWAYQNNVAVDTEYYSYFDNDQEKMFQGINSMIDEEVSPLEYIKYIIPSGTIIQNLRSSTIISEKEFTRDGSRLEETYGRYSVALGLLANFTGLEASTFDYTISGITEDERTIINQAIDQAIN